LNLSSAGDTIKKTGEGGGFFVIGCRTYAALIVIATGIAILPAALGSKNGADVGYSGGPAGEGQDCTRCHVFNEGPGRVELLGAPQRYRAGVVYDLTVRVTDSQQIGAGFEISAETGIITETDPGHVGTFLLRDDVHTRFAENATNDYVTHTRSGLDDSISNWTTNGGSYEFKLAWQAPLNDVGSITFFTAGNAVDDDRLPVHDRYYADYATIGFAHPGDADGDTDVDLLDFAELQRCFNGSAPATGDGCEYLDSDDNGAASLDDVGAWVDVRTGPTAALPAGFVLADAVRGGALYDRWWVVNGSPAPTGKHPLYPPSGLQSGSSTYRCKECHGWDYKGRDGVYGSGSHFTGIRGVFGTTLNPRQMFDLLKADPLTTPNGHKMDAFGMSERDLWDVVKFTSASVVDTDDYITPGGAFIGDQFNGQFPYGTACAGCHGDDGMSINFSSGPTPSYIGTVANGNPREFLHKVRFGHPGSPMPRTDLLRWSVQYAADISAYAASLPQ
jgi:thiosulfate dehydrogenase